MPETAASDRFTLRHTLLHLLLLTFLAAGIYLPRSTEWPLRGEETRWARIGIEMADSGDWVVPRVQGQVYITRPPLQSWLTGIIYRITGSYPDALMVRSTTLAAVIATVLLIYLAMRRPLGDIPAFIAACVYPTFFIVLEIGRRAESESLFTFFLAGALLLFIRGYHLGKSRLMTWLIASAFAALAALTKGTQAPVYFFGAVGLFLLVRRDWRWLLRPPAFAGLAMFLLIIAAWQIPFWQATGWEGFKGAWISQTTDRVGAPLGTRLLHVASFLGQTFACLLPWSPLLVFVVARGYWRRLGDRRNLALFCVIAATVGLVPLLLAPGAKTRYYIPIYPCIAVLIALSIEYCINAPAARPGVGWHHRNSQLLMGIIVLCIGPLLLAISLAAPQLQVDWMLKAQQPISFAIVFTLVGLIVGVVLIRLAPRRSPGAAAASAWLTAAFMGLAFTGAVLNGLIRDSSDPGAAVATLKAKLPPDAQLVSFGPVHHIFVFHYAEPIECRPWPGDMDADWQHICFMDDLQTRKRIRRASFVRRLEDWQQIAAINLDRVAKPVGEAENVIRVYRRKP